MLSRMFRAFKEVLKEIIDSMREYVTFETLLFILEAVAFLIWFFLPVVLGFINLVLNPNPIGFVVFLLSCLFIVPWWKFWDRVYDRYTALERKKR